MPTSTVKIPLHEPEEIPCSSATSLMVMLVFYLLSPKYEILLPLHHFCSTKDIQTNHHFLPQIYGCVPSSKAADTCKTCIQLTASSWNAVLTISYSSLLSQVSHKNLTCTCFSIIMNITNMTYNSKTHCNLWLWYQIEWLQHRGVRWNSCSRVLLKRCTWTSPDAQKISVAAWHKIPQK